jgi:ribose 5-phosphate isomerase B
MSLNKASKIKFKLYKQKPMKPKIYIAGDHASPALKSNLINLLTELKYQVEDLGTNDTKSVDYPDYANLLAEKLLIHPDAKGILICGTGIGISIAANRHKHIRAALCHSLEDAELTRQHNDANVLCIGARTTSAAVAQGMVQVFLNTQFMGGRHAKRIEKMC